MVPKLSLLIMLGFLATAAAQTTVTGRLVGADGKPMPKARVTLTVPNTDQVAGSVTANRHGDFEITVPSDGVWLLTFYGVYHRGYSVALYVDSSRTISLWAHLAKLDYLKHYKEIKIVGDFNKWYGPWGVPMKKQADGLYAAYVKTKMNPVHYQLIGVMDGGNVAGTDADAFDYDESHGFTSVLRTRRGGTKVTFDPSRLPVSNRASGFRFTRSSRVTAEFAAVYEQTQSWKKEHATAVMNAMKHTITERGKSSTVRFDFGKVLAAIDSRITSEKNAVVREELYLDYCRIAALAGPIDSLLARSTLNRIPFSSPVWLLEPEVFNYALQFSAYGERRQRQEIDRLLKENRWAAVKSEVLFHQFMYAKYMQQTEAAKYYYRALMSHYGHTQYSMELKKKFPNELTLQIGEKVPDFSVVSLENSAQVISRQSLQGKYYLIFFWKSGDRSCETEIEALRAAYRKYHGREFEILSLSVDKDYGETFKALAGEEKMPWLNAYLGSYMESKTATDFEVIAVPSLFLVGPRGELLAQGSDLVGANLEKTLARYIENKTVRGETSE